MKILYYNNCWFTNVGESFIDIGAMQLINNIWKDAQIACISNMSSYYAAQFHQEDKAANMEDYWSADYLILAGMFACDSFLESSSRQKIEKIVKKGTKLIFLGLGEEFYNGHENFSAWLKKVKPAFIMTRDKKTYEDFKDDFNCINGLDCAYWIDEVYNPCGFSDCTYDVITFNRSGIPEELKEYDKQNVVYPWHFQYALNEKKIRKNMMMSDTPYDYLTLYANANLVYTDLVHATIISLM